MTIKLEHQKSYLIGIISDTHGRLPSEVSNAFKDVDLIIHAGDIGEEAVLDKLSKIGPGEYGFWKMDPPLAGIRNH
jgi:predicted phosphodiesterase